MDDAFSLESVRRHATEGLLAIPELGQQIVTQSSSHAADLQELKTRQVEIAVPNIQINNSLPLARTGQIRVWEEIGRYHVEWSTMVDGAFLSGKLGDGDKGVELPTLSLRDDLGQPGKSKNREVFYKKVYGISYAQMLKLGKWLMQLDSRGIQDKNFYSLVILEHTSLQFPWEMVEFKDTNGQRKRIGTAFATTRWVETYRLEDISYINLESTVEGSALAYIDKTVNHQAEKTILHSYAGKNKVLETIQEMIEVLRKNKTSRFGLIYLGCHATFNEDKSEYQTQWLFLGHAHDRNLQISNFQWSLEAYKLSGLKRSVVFLNACHSGALSKTMDNGSEAKLWEEVQINESFPVICLATGANGVIATLGYVDDKTFAPNILGRLMKIIEGDVTVAEALRKLREEEDTKMMGLGRFPYHEELPDFMCAFMYVYYGNPSTKLKIGKGQL